MERSLFGPFRLAPFCLAVRHVRPPQNAIFTGAIFFALGTLTRKMMPVYVGAVVLALGYLAAQAILSDLDNKQLAAMLDSVRRRRRWRRFSDWTPSEKNTKLLPITGLLLANRAVWLSIGLGALGLTYAKFDFSAETSKDRPKKPSDDAEAPPPATTPSLFRHPSLIAGPASFSCSSAAQRGSSSRRR